MNNINYFIHLLILSLLQIVIVDNIHLGSYFYLNIYILALYILPYKMKGIPLLLFGFFLGLIMDLADNTVGIHAAASTFIAYIRPRLLQLIPLPGRNRRHAWRARSDGCQVVSEIHVCFHAVI